MSIKAIATHGFTTETPSKLDVKIGGLLLVVSETEAKLYTKLLSGKVVTVGEGVSNIADLLDVDLSQATEGSFITKQGDKYIATSLLGSISSLVDVEIAVPSNGQYMRYDSVTASFINYKPEYVFSEIVDVDVPAFNESVPGLNNHVLTYKSDTSTYVLEPRRNNITDLDDVSLSDNESYELLMYDPAQSKWANLPLKIERDPAPALGNTLDAGGFTIDNAGYRLKNITANLFSIDLPYSEADYYVVNGLPSGTQPQCILNPTFTSAKDNTISVMTLELRQGTGNLLIGGLTNVIYEDGKPILLSGAGKIDLVTITHVRKRNTVGSALEIYNYITATALNVAAAGEGGAESYRYDKNRYPDTQIFNPSRLYDDYYELVATLLNFEAEVASGKAWQLDKASRVDALEEEIVPTITHNVNQLATGRFFYGIEDFVAEFPTPTSTYSWSVDVADKIVLDGDWTLELFVQYEDTEMYESDTAIAHSYFNSPNLAVSYGGTVDTSQDTWLEVRHNTTVIRYPNAFRYFKYQNNRYIHIAVVRAGSFITLYVDGIAQVPVSASTVTITSSIDISEYEVSLKGSVNSLRLTAGKARYLENMKPIPSMRFGLVGGYFNPLEAQVHDLMNNIAELDSDPIAEQMFS